MINDIYMYKELVLILFLPQILGYLSHFLSSVFSYELSCAIEPPEGGVKLKKKSSRYGF